MSNLKSRIFLSPPHMSGYEMEMIEQAFAENWIAPVGPHVDAFEKEVASFVGSKGAVALSSGTAAIHLALRKGWRHGILFESDFCRQCESDFISWSSADFHRL